MPFDIYIEKEFHFSRGIINFGLVISGDPEKFPVYVGCSFRVNGEIIDLPARWLRSPGIALWEIESSEDRQRIFGTNRSGEVIFALYSDDTQEERLTDTGWYKWTAFGADMMGTGKMLSHMKSKYKDRNKEWITNDEVAEMRNNDPLGIRKYL